MHVDILDAVALGMFEISSCRSVQILMKLEMWANAQRDGRLPNIGGALCSTPQSLADAHYYNVVQ